MKKSVVATSQHDQELWSQDTSSTEVEDDDDSVDTKRAKKIKLKRGAVAEESLIEVTTIGTISTISNELVSLPPEVLGIVLQNLERNDLLQCRRVNALWRSSTRSILLGHDYEIQFNDVYESLLNKLKLFNECLKNARRLSCLDLFPCTRFKFTDTNLDENAVQRFFILYGSFIKSLRLRNCQSRTKKDGQLRTLSQLLTQQAPNIEELCITFFEINFGKQQYDGPITLFPKSRNKIKLPALKKLKADFYSRIQTETGIVKELLEVADNLEWYDIGHLDDQLIVNNFTSLKKVHVIKKVMIYLTEPELLKVLKEFAKLSPNLQCVGWIMHTSHHDQDDLELIGHAAGVVQKILESSSNTLEIIDKFQPIGFWPGFQMPILSRLKKIKMLTGDNRIKRSFFPRGLSLSTVFPNVTKVDLSIEYNFSDNFWTTFFPHIDLMDNTWPSVTSLKIKWPSESLDNFSRLFPNLKHLVLLEVDDFPLACRQIFAGMKKLKSLEFDYLYGGVHRQKFPALDSAFTGFSHETCKRLTSSEETLDDLTVEKLRENVSILELKYLKTLKLTRVCYFNSLILSRVSGIFAFQLMPQLRVTVNGFNNDQNTLALEAMTPFVHSVTLN